MKPKIIITVSGGVVTDVASNQDIDLIIIDHDDISELGKLGMHVYPADSGFEDGEAHKLYNDAMNPIEMEIKDELKRIHF